MAYQFPPIDQALPFDTILDVRSPAEFAEDHVPGAISLPALSDAERAEVGAIYVQDSRFRARRIGAAMVARNVARHLETTLADMPADWRPLVYCWRGGQRSGSVAIILRQIGWRVETLEGGYRSYRRAVQRYLYETPLSHRLVLLDGNTGTAKTELLARLAARGIQVLDLEGLARHRGSLFGRVAGGQPPQKSFESALAAQLAALDPARPVVVEAESSKVGERAVPPSLWAAMCAAPRISVTAPLEERARYTLTTYSDIADDLDRLTAILLALRPYHGAAQVEAWIAQARAGDLAALVADLMDRHYDPRYRKSAVARAGRDRILARVEVATLDDAGLDAAADEIAGAVVRHGAAAQD